MSGTGYDLSTSIYSQDGKIFQIEYARKSIENSETVVAIQCADGVILACEKIKRSPLQVRDSNKRIFSIDTHIALAVCGRLADGMIVVKRARSEAESYKESFGIPITGTILTERIANYIHAHTLYGNYRPLGISVVIASRDNNKNFLYRIENSGAFKGYFGCTAGKGHQVAKNYLEKIDRTKSCKEALDLVALSIVAAHEEFKEKTFEFEVSWIVEENNYKHKYLDWEQRVKLKDEAEEKLDE